MNPLARLAGALWLAGTGLVRTDAPEQFDFAHDRADAVVFISASDRKLYRETGPGERVVLTDQIAHAFATPRHAAGYLVGSHPGVCRQRAGPARQLADTQPQPPIPAHPVFVPRRSQSRGTRQAASLGIRCEPSRP